MSASSLAPALEFRPLSNGHWSGKCVPSTPQRPHRPRHTVFLHSWSNSPLKLYFVMSLWKPAAGTAISCTILFVTTVALLTNERFSRAFSPTHIFSVKSGIRWGEEGLQNDSLFAIATGASNNDTCLRTTDDPTLRGL